MYDLVYIQEKFNLYFNYFQINFKLYISFHLININVKLNLILLIKNLFKNFNRRGLMKISKNLLICALLVLVMLCVVSTASAEDTINENLTVSDADNVILEEDNSQDELEVSDNEEKLSEGNTLTVGEGETYTTIASAVSAASSGDTIFIKNGEYSIDTKISPTVSLSFIGESQDGVKITSNTGGINLFESYTNGISLTFKNLYFNNIDFGTKAATALRIGGDINLNVVDCSFVDCTSKNGVMYLFSTGTSIVDNCQIKNLNVGASGGTAGIFVAGDGKYYIKNTIIDNSKNELSSGYANGVIYLNAKTGILELDNVTISNCFLNAVSGSAIIYAKSEVNIKNSKFIDNTINKTGSSDVSLFYLNYNSNNNPNTKINMNQSMIYGNTATNLIYSNNNNAKTIVKYCNINDNSVSALKSSNGNYDFESNYWGSNSLPDGVTVSTWIVEEDGVYKLNTGETIDVIIPGLNDQPEPEFPTDSIFVATNGSDENDGSENSPVFNITKAIELAKLKSGYIVIKEGNYSQNNILIDGDKNITIIGQGNVILNATGLDANRFFTIETNNVTFKNIKFTDNEISLRGAAIYVEGNSKTDLLDINIVVENCSFDNLKAGRGGAIYAYYTKGNLKVIKSTFNNIQVSGWGGAICAAQSAYDTGLNVAIEKSTFSNNKANNGGALYIQASKLDVSESEFFKNTAVQSPGAIYLTNVTATFDNCKICNNSALKDASAIAVYAGIVSTDPTVLKPSMLTITNSIIENNTATQEGAAAIYLENSKMDISYSSIVNALNIKNTVTANYDNNQPEVVIANNNWWGVNNPKETVDGNNITINTWVIMNVEANATEVLVGDKVKLTVDFNHVNTTSGEIQELAGGEIPKTFTVTFTSDSGSIEPQSVEISKGTTKDVIYTVVDVDAIVTAKCEDAIKTLSFAKGVEPYYGTIYVDKKGSDDNNGSEEYPVASISKAVELALVSGGSGEIIINEGTYNGANFHITGDLKVTGNGKVTIDAEGKGRLFFMNYGESLDKFELSNIIIQNVTGHGGVAYVYGSELTLNNITVLNSNYGNYLVYSNGNIKINGSAFSNNTGGDIIQMSAKEKDITINNTIFRNNTITTSYGIVYFSQGGGNLIIESSKFLDNKVNQAVITGSTNSFGTSQTNIEIADSDFINNNNTIGFGAAVRSNGKLDISNSKFIDNNAKTYGGAISIGSDGVATITKSIFNNNAATTYGDSIYNQGKLTVNYTILLNNANHKTIYNNGKFEVNAQYNWWGTNDNPSSLNGVGTYEEEDDSGWDTINVDCPQADSSNWVVMTVSNNLTDDIVNIDNQIEFTVDFTHTNTGAVLTDSIPEVEVSAAAVTGLLDAQKITTENNVAKFTYTAYEGGEDTVTITSSNEINTTTINVKVPVVLEVVYLSATGDDANNGTRSSPLATLEHAIEIAQRGKIVILEGNYTIAKTIVLEKDMNIIGEGNVLINGNLTKIFDNYANLNLTNIKFTNASSAVGSIVVNQDETSVVISDCEFYLNKATGTSGGIIHIKKGSLNLTSSKFHENTIKRGVVSAASDTSIVIKDCEFLNHNTTQQYGLIKLDGCDAVIENSIFRNNSIGNGAGIYITSSKTDKTIKINNDTFIDNKATHTSGGNGGAIFINIGSGLVDLTISNSKFINNNAAVNGGAIYTTGNNVNVKVDGCLFINNTAKDGNSIYVNNGEFEISNSVILNENGIALNKSSSVHTSKINAVNNYWGDNAKANADASITVSSWIVMNASYTVSDEGVLTITATFDKTNSTAGEIADYAGKLPDGFDVTFTSSSGILNENVKVKDAKASVEYTRDAYLDSEITVKVLNDEVIFPFAVKPKVIYVSTKGDDNNDGDRDTPVASLEQALKLAEKGQIVILEGTYKTGDLGIISDDLTITGEGKVIIDAQNSNRVLYVGEDAKVILKNLIFVNGFTSEESGALLGNSNELTIINCTLANSSAGENNGGAIYNVGKLTIINSTIANNTARLGGAVFSHGSLAKEPTISIENSVIENNIATGNDNSGGGAIFAQQLAGMTISNTTFENNQAQTTSSGGAIFISHSNANMKIKDSRFIKNHANGQEQSGGGAIYFAGESLTPYRTGTLTISNTLFEGNTADTNGGAIYSRATNVNVENSVLINNTDENGISVYGYQTEQVAPAITANKNWWGTNDKPAEFIGGNNKYKPTVNNWAILTITNDTEIKDGNNVRLTVAIDSYTDGETVSKLENPITVPVPVIISTNKGDIQGVLTNGEFTYDLDATGIKFVSAKVDGVEEVLFKNTVATTIAINNITALKGDIVEYTITVTSADGSVVNKGKVELRIDNVFVTAIDVADGIAKDKISITQNIGSYNITAVYTDLTEQFASSEANNTLTVTGVNNIVTPETFNHFFDENGYLKEEFILDEIIFKGEFKDLGIISIDKPVKVTGDNAVFNNTALSIECDDVSVSNINFIADKQFTGNDDALIYIGGDNTVLTNNNITYNAPDDVESHVIEIDYASNVKITDNNIKYSAKSNGTVETIAVTGYEANNLVFENNKLEAEIPSVDNYKSKGVNIENSNNVIFNKNTISVKYSHVNGTFDTVVGVDLEQCQDSRVTDNTIDVTGNGYAYALITNFCDNITVSGNDIKSEGNNYANGVQVGGDSTGAVDSNNISAKATNVTYPVYFDDYGSDSEVNLTNNNVTGESDTVYGVYVEENRTLISNNNISVNGNYVYGIITHQTDVVIDGNDIKANGKDIGSIVSPQSGVNENTTGIIVSEGSAKITNNNVVTTGQSAIAAVNTNADIVKNGLTANGTTANETIKNINSNVISANNTAAKNETPQNTTPANPVVKIIAASNAKVDYGFKYTVRVTVDGKSVGAGKKVTLKIAGKTLSALTNANGYAAFTLAVKPNAYNVIAAYDKVTQQAKVTVKNVIKAKNLKIKKSARKVRIKVTLKTSAKKPIKGKKVTLKIKGKKITAKTNKKGVATFKIKKSILKKLKAGKKYKYQVIYGKDTVKKTLKVRR